MISFTCPACQAPLSRDDQDAGSKLTCPSCGQRLQVPRPAANRTVLGEIAPPSTPGEPKDQQAAAFPARPAMRRIACPSCGQEVIIPADLVGKDIVCPRCHAGLAGSAGLPAAWPGRSPTAPAAQRIYVQQNPAVQRKEIVRTERLEQSVTNRSNLWMWFVGLPLGILLLTLAGCLITPVIYWGVQEIKEAQRQRAEQERLAEAERERVKLEQQRLAGAERERVGLEQQRLADAERERLRLEQQRLAETERERRKAAEEEREKQRGLERLGWKPYYPKPTTGVNGKNAEEWYTLALSRRDHSSTQQQTLAALVSLREEGMPFLLNWLEKQGTPAGREMIVRAMNVQYIHANDLPKLVSCLERGRCDVLTRMFVLRQLQKRKEAAAHIERIETLVADLLKSNFDTEVKDILRAIRATGSH